MTKDQIRQVLEIIGCEDKDTRRSLREAIYILESAEANAFNGKPIGYVRNAFPILSKTFDHGNISYEPWEEDDIPVYGNPLMAAPVEGVIWRNGEPILVGNRHLILPTDQRLYLKATT